MKTAAIRPLWIVPVEPLDRRGWSTATWRGNGTFLILLGWATYLAILATGCSSAPTAQEKAAGKVADAASGGWFSQFLERVAERFAELAISVGAGVVATVAVGVDVLSGGLISLATLFASFAFRPAQVVNNVDTGGGDYAGGGGETSMSFLEWWGLASVIFLFVKYLVIPRSARNFWGGMWGVITKRGHRGASLRRIVAATGCAHTSKDTAAVAAGKATAVPGTSPRFPSRAD